MMIHIPQIKTKYDFDLPNVIKNAVDIIKARSDLNCNIPATTKLTLSTHVVSAIKVSIRTRRQLSVLHVLIGYINIGNAMVYH